MKKMTARLLAMIVALCVLTMPAAMAEANPFALTDLAPAFGKNTATLTVGNFELTMNDESISLPLYLSLIGGADIAGERGMIALDLSTADQSAASAYAVLENGEIKAYLEGMEYGFYLPLDEIMAQLETELGAAMTDLTEQIPEEMQTAITNLMVSALALEAEGEPDPEALLNALGITYEEKGTAEVAIFDEDVTCDAAAFTMKTQTMAEYMDAMASVSPAFSDYWASYTELFDTAIAQTGEEVTMKEALSMISMGLSGDIYATETHVLAELTMSMTVEGETLDIPFSIAAAVLEDRSTVDISMLIDVEGDLAKLGVFVDESTADDATNMYTLISMSILDSETEEIEEGFDLSVSAAETAEDSYFSVGLLIDDGWDAYNLGFEYFGLPVEITEEGDESYTGMLGLYAYGEDESYTLSMDTSLVLSDLPEGELLTLPEGSINIMEITEEQMEALETDVQIPVMQAMGVLMQDENLASMLLGAMN